MGAGGRARWALGVVVAAFVSIAPGARAADPIVATSKGLVRGVADADGHSFRAIPFAAPADGARRFAAPQPAAPFKGILDARRLAPACPQAVASGLPYSTREDCLTVDVSVPPGATRASRLPVMVYVYGGAYVLGATHQYPSRQLAARGDVVVVSVNYRVGPFGFLALPGATPNTALLDQQAGLRWVRREIGRFGGDPGNVTLFGESAGGNSVCQQLASPRAAGLFDKAIVMSGACSDGGTLDAQSAAAARRDSEAYARDVGCDVAPARMVACLRSRSVSELLRSPTVGFASPSVTWRPTIDGRTVTAPSGTAFAAGRAQRVPTMIGGMRDEGNLFVFIFERILKGRIVLPERYKAAVLETFPDRADAILARYPLSDFASPSAALGAVYTDGLFACDGLRSTRALAATAPAAYAYEIRERSLLFSNALPNLPLGAYHAGEIPLLFFPGAITDPALQALSSRLIEQWTTFARTGSPTGPDLPPWPPASTGQAVAIDRTGQSTVSLDDVAAEHRCDAWPAATG